MPKMNWTKINSERRGHTYCTGNIVGQDTTWRWGKQHRWQSIYKIPTDYLLFVADKWHKGKARDMADKEILRRVDQKGETL